MTGSDGVLVVDKPPGPTSHDVVDRVRKAFGTRRVGHTGTLDPFATGVLAVCVGKATRLSRFLMEGEKVYVAGVRLGFSTTTDDFTGEALGPPQASAPERSVLEAACQRFVGPLEQVPPAYSAKRVAGRKMYELARTGKAIERAASRVFIHAIRLGAAIGDSFEIEVRCSPGTYMRALARDLGEALGAGGHLVSLRRTRSGEFGLEGAVPWDDLVPAARNRLIPMARLLSHLPAVRVAPEGLQALGHGQTLVARQLLAALEFSAGQRVRILDPTGELLALAVAENATLKPDVVLLESP